ncbi:EEF1A lysine methyltransferase 1 isoform X2 [Manis pentadactyla]|uniref:EEF1A lysine methyltransferase 1 isoform X2 n=1 Tax=Manis pentadactyla TaxID=143292 RepID=UPI00255C4317|nr:EEF1A lysine methyltransferase 1 isoform X2 [Manis pentadactyla]
MASALPCGRGVGCGSYSVQWCVGTGRRAAVQRPGVGSWLCGAGLTPVLRRSSRGRVLDSEMSASEDGDIPQLSSHALAALQEFYAEQMQQTSPGGDDKYNIGIIEENWLSQFWYSRETALCLAKEAAAAAGECGRIACVSAPSVYQNLRELRGDFSVYIFEYDRRFAIYGEEFVFYDYNNPLDLPEKIAPHSFDIVVADPPYLSEECLRKTSETIKFLTRGKILLCTGAVMEEEAARLLGVKMCKFIPKHNRNLANEFRCYVNYDSGLDRET